MLKHYFKIALRSLRKQLGYAAINIFGLAIGLTCVMLVSMFVLFERSYDTFHEKAGDIYRVAKENRINYEPSTRFTATPLPLADALMAELPEVEFATHIRKTEVVMEYEGSRFDEAGIYTSPHFFDVFSFSLLQGNPATALSEPNAIVLTASLAKKYFGTTSPVGQPLTIIHDSAPVQMQITGVVEDVPANSHFTFDYLISITSSPRYRWDSQNWDNNGYMTYAALTPGADQATFATKLTQLAHNYLTQLDYYQRNPGEVSNYFPQALTDIHLTSHLRFEFGVNGDIKYVYLFAVIGLLILLISVINYVNLATARSATRMVEMGVRKIVGAHRKQITGQFIAEATLYQPYWRY